MEPSWDWENVISSLTMLRSYALQSSSEISGRSPFFTEPLVKPRDLRTARADASVAPASRQSAGVRRLQTRFQPEVQAPAAAAARTLRQPQRVAAAHPAWKAMVMRLCPLCPSSMVHVSISARLAVRTTAPFTSRLMVSSPMSKNRQHLHAGGGRGCRGLSGCPGCQRAARRWRQWRQQCARRRAGERGLTRASPTG